MNKLVLSTRTSLNAASKDYDKLTDPTIAQPTAPVFASRLSTLLKSLANAEGAVAESIKARKQLIEGLEKLLSTNRDALASEESQLVDVSARKLEIDNKKKDVEDGIMRGLANPSPSTPIGASPGLTQTPATPAEEYNRPEVEALTPPGFPARRPAVLAPELDLDATNVSATEFNAQMAAPLSNVSADIIANYGAQPPGIQQNPVSKGSGVQTIPGPSSAKKRKLNDGDEFAAMGDDGLDDEVQAMLRQESGTV
jgi:regulator of Ty1 transposition protein 103